MRSVRSGLFLLLFLCACEDAKVPTAPPDGRKDAGPEPDSGPSYVRDAGADGSTAESRGPRVTFTSPLPASDPNTGELITEPTLRVACKVERALYVSAAAVDKATVKIALLKPHEGEAEDEKAEVWTDAPVNAVADDTFEAQFELRTLPNGPLQFRCVARDLATVPNTTTTKLRTLLDLGPKVEISKPNLASYALKSPVAIEFKIEASPVTSDDAEAEVDEIKLLVSGVPVDFEESMTTPGLYQANVDFDDRAQFPVPPESAQVTVTASNKRSPTVALRSVTKAIVIDGEGPSIVVKAPIDGQIVPYGENPLVVEVRDPSGVRASSLVANFNSGTLVLRDWKGVEPTFTHSFNPGSFGTQLTRLTVQISATDNVGNETMVPLVLKLDNLPPVISITPPLIREWRKNGNNLECSTLFDPVGADVPNDGQPLTGTAYFRALVEDKTNKPIVGPFDPSPVTYSAGIDNEEVELFMQRDVSIPLLINQHGNDEICDQINVLGLAEAKQPRALKLSPVNPNGSSWYKIQDESLPDDADCFTPTTMQPPITQPVRPNPICMLTSMRRVVPGRSEGRPPALYALRPTNASTGECTGEYWELVGVADPGWICVAARAVDTKGNVGVSEPVRLCYGENPNMTPDCSGMPMPSCTDGCTISEAQKFHPDEGSWYFP